MEGAYTALWLLYVLTFLLFLSGVRSEDIGVSALGKAIPQDIANAVFYVALAAALIMCLILRRGRREAAQSYPSTLLKIDVFYSRIAETAIVSLIVLAIALIPAGVKGLLQSLVPDLVLKQIGILLDPWGPWLDLTLFISLASLCLFLVSFMYAVFVGPIVLHEMPFEDRMASYLRYIGALVQKHAEGEPTDGNNSKHESIDRATKFFSDCLGLINSEMFADSGVRIKNTGRFALGFRLMSYSTSSENRGHLVGSLNDVMLSVRSHSYPLGIIIALKAMMREPDTSLTGIAEEIETPSAPVAYVFDLIRPVHPEFRDFLLFLLARI